MKTYQYRVDMSHDVTSNNQSGGVTAGEISGDAYAPQGVEEGKSWGQVVSWILGGLAAIATVTGFILKVTGVI